jgi:hypothetical protein
MLAMGTFLSWKANMNIVLMMRMMVVSVKSVFMVMMVVKADDGRKLCYSFDSD